MSSEGAETTTAQEDHLRPVVTAGVVVIGAVTAMMAAGEADRDHLMAAVGDTEVPPPAVTLMTI